MLWLNPERVTLTIGAAAIALENVTGVAVDRVSERLAVERADSGPHVVFADAPEQRVTIRIVRAIAGEEGTIAGALVPSAQGALSFRVAGSVGDAGGRVVSATVVVTGVTHDLTGKRGGVQTIEMLAISGDGGADPITQQQEGP